MLFTLLGVEAKQGCLKIGRGVCASYGIGFKGFNI